MLIRTSLCHPSSCHLGCSYERQASCSTIKQVVHGQHSIKHALAHMVVQIIVAQACMAYNQPTKAIQVCTTQFYNKLATREVVAISGVETSL
jgi:hypothetical protein